MPDSAENLLCRERLRAFPQSLELALRVRSNVHSLRLREGLIRGASGDDDVAGPVPALRSWMVGQLRQYPLNIGGDSLAVPVVRTVPLE
jgi:hypothetical protein